MTAAAEPALATIPKPGPVIEGRFRTGKRLQVQYDGSWIILVTRRDLAWQRVRYALAGAALFAAGVVTARIWR